MKIKAAIFGFFLVALSTLGQGIPHDRIVFRNNASLENIYMAGANISNGQLVKVSNTATGGIANVVPMNAGDTTGILGVADGSATTGNPINVRIQGQGFVLTDGGCAIGNNLVSSGTVGGSATCVTSPGSLQSAGFSLGVLGVPGLVSGAINAGGGGGGGGGGGNPGNPIGCVQFNISSSFQTSLTPICLDSPSLPTTLTVPLNLTTSGDLNVGGPDYAIDIRNYNARAVSIHTTGTGSGTSLTVGSTNFKNKDYLTVANGGPAPAINPPTGITVNPGASEGETVIDVPTANGMTGSSTYNYCVFGMDVFGGATKCSSTATITNGNAALGETQFTISTWSLTVNTLTIVTTVSSGLPVGTLIHTTGTSNNALAGGWYPISTISGATITVNNVFQYAASTIAGTSGTLTAFIGNALTWTASTGGTVGNTNTVWDYGICAQRPGDGAFHIIGFSFLSTVYNSGGDQYVATRFVDFGSGLTSNVNVPWWLSDANCTAGAAQNELAKVQVQSGGSTTGLTITPALSNSVTGTGVRLDNALAIFAAAIAASTQHASLYIPANQTFETNSQMGLPSVLNIWQAGNLVLNGTVIVSPSTNWFGNTGVTTATQFGFNGAPNVQCGINPCVYVGSFSNPSTGADTFTNLQFTSSQNGLLFLVDEAWGQIWDKVTFQAGTTNNDFMGIALMIRPGAANYKIRNSTFIGGPGQFAADQTWAPLVYLAPSGAGACCGGGATAGNTDFDNNMFNRRGIYRLSKGGTGILDIIHGLYRQGGLTPMFMVQNTNGNQTGEIIMDGLLHDTEAQAAYAWICGPGCSAGFSSMTSMDIHLGSVNPNSQDAGTTPAQITGGGNSAILNAVAVSGAGALVPAFSTGWYVIQGALFPVGNITTSGGPFGLVTSIVPNVPTPMLSLQGGSFASNMSGTFTATRTVTVPDSSGTLCLTTTCGGQFYQTFQANGTPLTQETTANYVAGANMTITPSIVGGVTTLTFVSTNTAATAWSAITASTNSNAGSFVMSGNTLDLTAAAAFNIPKLGMGMPGATSGSINFIAPATTANWTWTAPPNAGAVGNYLATDGTGISTWQQINFTQLQGSVACNQMPSLGGDIFSTAGFCTAAVLKVNGVSYPANPAINTVPVVTGPNTVAYQAFPSTVLFQTNNVSNASQTGLNMKPSTVNSIGGIVTPTNTGTVVETYELTGLINSTGGGCGVSAPAVHSMFVAEGASPCNLLASPTLNGVYYPTWVVTSNAAVEPTVVQVGLPPRSLVGAATTDTFAAADVGKIVSHDVTASASITETLPTAITLNNPNYQATYCNRSNQTDSIVPTTWTIQNGNNGAAASLSIPSGVCVRITVDANSATQWHADEYGVGTVTGDGAMYNNSGSTGSVVLSLANAAANTIWGNPTGSGATPVYFRPTAHFLQLTMACNDSSGSGTAEVCSTSPTFTPAAGDTILYKTTTGNSGDLTIAVNGAAGAHARKWLGSTILANGDLPANIPTLATFDGTFWDFYTIGNAPSGGGGTGFSAITGGTNGSAAMIIGTGGSLTVSGSGTNNATSVNSNTFSASAGLTSGGVIFASSTSAYGSSSLLTANSPVLGGGAGVAPKTIAGISSDGTSVLNLGVAGVSVGCVKFANATSGSISLCPVTGALGAVTLTLPAATDTLVDLADTQALSNKTVNGLTLTALATGFSVAGGTSSKTLTVSNTMILAGTDASTYTFPSASATITQTIASGTATLGTTSIGSGLCATVVTVSATGVATTDRINWNANQSIKAVTGYAPTTTGGLSIAPYPTLNNVNFDVCNWSGSSITPGAVTLNWAVTR